MATMVPNIPVAVTESSAELEMFRLLKEQLPDEFHVYHSVAFVLSGGRHHAPHEGEIDFLIVHRELGLLAIEVKGGRIAYDGRQLAWTSTGRYGTNVINDPLRQAENGIHKLAREIEQRHIFSADPPNFARGFCVAFPDCTFDPAIAPTQCPAGLVIDDRKLDKLKDSVTTIMTRWARQPGRQAMTRQQMKLLSQRILAPRFQLGLTLQGEFAWEERALRLLTEEQSICLDFLSLNSRSVVHGPAGTGKTVIALEHARQQAEQGARVVLLCFNLPLARQLRSAAESYVGLSGSIWAGAYHELCRDWAAKVGLPFNVPPESDAEAVSKFWDEESSFILLDAIEKRPDRFDVLIVDEAQDMHRLWWDVLPSLLASPSGGFVVFHDPEQNIYDRDGALPLAGPVFPLRTNCRCTQPIGRYAANLVGVRCRTPFFAGGGEEPKTMSYRTAEEQYKAVSDRVAALVAAGIRAEQIMLLGTHRLERSFLAGRKEVAGLKVAPFDERSGDKATGGYVSYSTLHRFKGLEADVVLLCDLDGNPRTCTRRHVYVAASRAKHRLYLFCETKVLAECGWMMP